MGGYGALATAGAGYSKKGMPAQFVPGGYLDPRLDGSADYPVRLPKNLKALVAIAPWGAQPPYNSWDPAALANIRVPSLWIDGDQDDVSDYQHGVRPAFDEAVNSDRCLLVYENARHNIGGNPPPPGVDLDFQTREFFDEPVWRKDRIGAINQHFITAFLDLYVKGDTTQLAYLHPVSGEIKQRHVATAAG
jgi:pimeloyl-ACP methyl ester carboxylesterase